MKDHTGERQALARGERGQLGGAPVDTGVIVEAARAVDHPLDAEAIGLELPLDVDAEAQDQLFHVERIAAQLPRAGAQCFELLRAQDRSCDRQNDRGRARNAGIGAQRAAQRQVVARPLIEPQVEHDAVRQIAPRQLQHLLALGGGHDPIAALRQHALERFGQPLVGIPQQD